MITTTDYGSWNNYGDNSNSSVEETLADCLSGADREWRESVESSGAFNAMIADYRAAINRALPHLVSLVGDRFIGPAYDKNRDWDGELDIAGIIEGVDLMAIIEKHDPDNQSTS